MSDERSTEAVTLAATEAERVDRACDRFEDELWAGRRPSIEAFLDGVEGPARADLLAKLIGLEVDWRLDANERPAIAEYAGRFQVSPEAVAAAFPTRAPGDAGAEEPTATIAPPPDVVLGGRYRLVDEVGGDGMGVIWLARDSLLHREVALKEIRPRYASSPEMRARFHRETRVTARLDHPGIVTVHDLGQREGGDPFYVMHLIRGEDLRKSIRRLHGLAPADDDDPARGSRTAPPRLDLHALVGRLADACLAVAYAHQRKVIHRDIKPGNIMLGPFGETFVIDWGLTKRHDGPSGPAREADAGLGPEPSLGTAADPDETPSDALGRGPGTLGYMPPEQLRSDPALVGPESDIFSLGATLYCLLTGHRPFTGTEAAMVAKTLACDFPPPRKLKPCAPADLEAVCLKAMAADPAGRYASARDLADDLGRWLADEPVLARPEPLASRIARLARRHRTAAVAAAVLLATMTLALGIFGVKVRAERERSDANFESADGAIRETLAAAEGPDLSYLPGAGAIRARLVASTIGLRRRLLAGRPADPGARFDLAHALRTSAAIEELTGPKPAADALRREALGLLGPLAADQPGSRPYRVELARARIDGGDALMALGKPRQAEPLFDQALTALGPPPEGAEGREIRIFAALAHLGRAEAFAQTGRAAEGRREVGRAFDLVRPAADDVRYEPYEVIVIGHVLIARAVAAARAGEAAAARADLADAIFREGRLCAAQPNNFDARFVLASAKLHLARLAEAGPQARETLAQLYEAVSDLNALMKLVPTNPAYRRELAAGLILRAGQSLATNPQVAERDASDARKLLDLNRKDAPDVVEYLEQLALTLEFQARVARARNKPDVAGLRLHEAINFLDAARRANPEHPDYQAAWNRCRAAL